MKMELGDKKCILSWFCFNEKYMDANFAKNIKGNWFQIYILRHAIYSKTNYLKISCVECFLISSLKTRQSAKTNNYIYITVLEAGWIQIRNIEFYIIQLNTSFLHRWFLMIVLSNYFNLLFESINALDITQPKKYLFKL